MTQEGPTIAFWNKLGKEVKLIISYKPTTLFMPFSVTYYPELRIATTFYW